MSKKQARVEVQRIEQILGDGDCGRFYSLKQCKAMAAKARDLCRKFKLLVPLRCQLKK